MTIMIMKRFVPYDTSGPPVTLAGFTTGAVFVTALQVNRQWPPVNLNEPAPRFSWHNGDALNTNTPALMVQTNLGSVLNDSPACLVVGNFNQRATRFRWRVRRTIWLTAAGCGIVGCTLAGRSANVVGWLRWTSPTPSA